VPTYDFLCLTCEAYFEVFRPMSEADAPASCPEFDSHETMRVFSISEAFIRDRAPVRKAQVRQGEYWDRPGSIVDHIVTGDGSAQQRQTEKDLLQAAKESGVAATEETIVLKGDPPRRRARGLISYPGRPARTQTRDEARH
jgi:putative FmdB family regulatory protein